jgi:hypothetical protein
VQDKAAVSFHTFLLHKDDVMSMQAYLCKKYTWTSSEKPNQTRIIAGLLLSKHQLSIKIIDQTVKLSYVEFKLYPQ